MPKLSILLLMFNLSAVAFVASAQERVPDVSQLTPGKTTEREINGGQTQSFLVTLQKGQLLRAVVTSHDIDVVVTLYDPGAQKLLTVDLLKHPSPEPVSFEVDNAGEYRLEIRGDAASVVHGRYELASEVKQQAQGTDKQRLTAERLLTEANDLEREGSKESLQKSIDKRGEALALWQKLGDRYWEAYSLHYSGRAAASLGKNQDALDLYNRALKIRREIGDRIGEAGTLNNIGIIFVGLGEKDKALDCYNQAVAISRAAGDRIGEARTLNNLANFYRDLGENKKALEFYNQALSIKRALGDKPGEAEALLIIGNCFSHLGEKQKALDYYKQSLALNRSLGNKLGEANTLNNFGNVYRELGAKQKALDYFNQALLIKRAVGDRLGEASTLGNIGLVYADLGKNLKALDYYNQALTIDRAIDDRSGEANTLSNIGLVRAALGDTQRALDDYNQALLIQRALEDKSGEAQVLKNIGYVYVDMGEIAKALEYYNQALPICRLVGDKAVEAGTLLGIANAHYVLGQKQSALDEYNQALTIDRAIGDESGEAEALLGIGLVHDNLGEYKQASEYYNQALLIQRSVGDKLRAAGILNNLGNLFRKLGERQKALEFYNQALHFEQAVEDRSGEANTLGNIGLIYNESGDKERALDNYNKVLVLKRETGDMWGEAIALLNIGVTYDDMGKKQEALNYYRQALQMNRAIGDKAGEAYVLHNLGNVYYVLGKTQDALELYSQALYAERAVGDKAGEAVTLQNLMWLWKPDNSSLAIFFGKQSVNVLQGLRANIVGFERSVQRSFLHSKEDVYRGLASILISHGRLSEAEEVLGLLKDEEYSSLRSRGDPKSEVDYSPIEAEAVKALDQIGELGREENELRDNKEKKTLDEKGQQRLEQLAQELLPKANADFRRALTAIEKEAPGSAVKTAEVKEAQSLMRYLRELGPGTVALYTVVSTEQGKTSKGWVILVTPNFQKAYEMDVADLDQTVAEFRQTLRSDQYDPQPLALKLYRMIFQKPQKQGKTLAADLEDYLRDQKGKTLMWSLDGVLRYVPMAALHDGDKYLVERYRNAVFTTASLPGLTHTTSKEWNALGLGVSKKYEGFTALSGVPKELSAIVRDGSKHTTGVLPGAIKWDDEFKEKSMMDSLSEGYNVVHIASHFSYQAANPERSFLLLGDGGHLEVSKIQDLTTLFDKADLVTLSACDTAVGSLMKDANGKDVEGFAYVTQKLGAMAVVASLWPVDDIGTQVLMPKFYALHQNGLNKAEALRQAQLSLLHGDVQQTSSDKNQKRAERVGQTQSGISNQPFKSDPKAPYAHPYYWAPFILIGNWK